MASSWGASWGRSWGNAWGVLLSPEVPQVPVPRTEGGGMPSRHGRSSVPEDHLRFARQDDQDMIDLVILVMRAINGR